MWPRRFDPHGFAREGATMGRVPQWVSVAWLAGLSACANEVVTDADPCNGAFIDISAEFAGEDTPSSVAWDGQSFWVSNYAQGSGKRLIYRYDKPTCQSTGHIPSPGEYTNSLCFDGVHLWLTDYTLNYLQLFELSSVDGSRVAAFAAPHGDAQPGGIAFDGQSLYYAACSIMGQGCTVDQVDPNTGAVLGQIYATNDSYWIAGITYKDGSLFWLARSESNEVPSKIVNITLEGVELSAVDLPATELTVAYQIVSLANSEGELWYLRALGPLGQQGIVRFNP
jgi:hypothetical protein